MILPFPSACAPMKLNCDKFGRIDISHLIYEEIKETIDTLLRLKGMEQGVKHGQPSDMQLGRSSFSKTAC